MAYEHLRLEREAPVNPRHRRKFNGFPKPPDPKEFGEKLGRKFLTAKERIFNELDGDVAGFDDRKLITIRLREGDKSVPPFDAIPGVEILSQEDESLILAFASDQGLQEFETRLATLARDGTVTRKDLLFAIEDFDRWSPQDRKGNALTVRGFPEEDVFNLDVELWPQLLTNQRDRMVNEFKRWLTEHGIAKLDELKQPSLVMLRVRCSLNQAHQLLRHRDVRTVDLPPRLGIEVGVLYSDINAFPQVPEPPHDAPIVGVLDSGLTPSHPLLHTAVGDAQGYLAPQHSSNDHPPFWHGTFVAGLAVYGNIEEKVRQGHFLPQLRVVAGKVFNDDGTDQTEFVERAVEEAVRDLNERYRCRVFNLSYGDLNKVYDGRHVRGLAYTLDRLARELDVLFVVPTGNLENHQLPETIHDYPDYLLEESARLIDPATSLNALTVGGLSEFEATRETQRHPETIEDHVLARANQPYPMTRRGPSVNGAVKPDLVEHAGNIALMRTVSAPRNSGLGVISLNGGFAGGVMLKEDHGTSYAAPQLAHKAARLRRELPEASSNLIRALLGAHAYWPHECSSLLNGDNHEEGRKRILQLIGYGKVNDEALYRSLDDTVTLFAEELIEDDKHHFFELPLPESFWGRGRRLREVSVALAYSPEVRTTRIDYRRSKLWFNLVVGESLEEISESFRRGREQGMPERDNGRWIPNEVRKNGTLQVSRWTFKRSVKAGCKVFIVVTRQDSLWSVTEQRSQMEPYALTIVVADREQVNAQLHSEIRIALQERAQARARART